MSILANSCFNINSCRDYKLNDLSHYFRAVCQDKYFTFNLSNTSRKDFTPEAMYLQLKQTRYLPFLGMETDFSSRSLMRSLDLRMLDRLSLERRSFTRSLDLLASLGIEKKNLTCDHNNYCNSTTTKCLENRYLMSEHYNYFLIARNMYVYVMAAAR